MRSRQKSNQDLNTDQNEFGLDLDLGSTFSRHSDQDQVWINIYERFSKNLNLDIANLVVN